MAPSLKDLGIDRLSVEDRITLVQEIWDSIEASSEQIPLTDAQRQELERRLAAYEASPSAVVSWEEVKAKALARART
jgi:putative addiction module component (TIGR02574 family)